MTIVLSDLPTAVQEAVATTRQRVADLHAELPRNELVVWTAGNVSERVPMPTEPAADSRPLPGLFVIKPSGVSYDELTAETMVVRSEERRVGKECRSRWAQSHEKRMTQ